jgi:hypothetical protein
VLTTIGQALLEAVRGFVDWALGFGDSSLNFVTRTPAEGSPGLLWRFQTGGDVASSPATRPRLHLAPPPSG